MEKPKGNTGHPPEPLVQSLNKQHDTFGGDTSLSKEKPGYDPFLSKPDKKEKVASLMERVREASSIATREDTSGNFNAMAWLDLELENNLESFDIFFDTLWNELSDSEREKRTVAIRRVL